MSGDRTIDDIHVRDRLAVEGVTTAPEDLICLLEAMARSTNAKASQQDIILEAAAHMLRAYHKIAVDLV